MSELTAPCPGSHGAPNPECPHCDGSGQLMTLRGKRFAALLAPIIDAKIRDRCTSLCVAVTTDAEILRRELETSIDAKIAAAVKELRASATGDSRCREEFKLVHRRIDNCEPRNLGQ